MPVSNASIFTFCSVSVGAARWMGSLRVAETGPRSSTGSPTTFRIRPRTSLPTGIVIGAPVLFTGMPRTRPSVESIEMQRAVFSPRCWDTSMMRLSCRASMPGFVTASAV
jgi:hypothetical protein